MNFEKMVVFIVIASMASAFAIQALQTLEKIGTLRLQNEARIIFVEGPPEMQAACESDCLGLQPIWIDTDRGPECFCRPVGC